VWGVVWCMVTGCSEGVVFVFELMVGCGLQCVVCGVRLQNLV